MALQGTKNLETWCKTVTEGKVNVVNMSSSWKNGLGFCAIIHHFRPDLIDFDNLDPNDVFGNNDLAFRIAETHLGIPALLDPTDMLECSVPDRLSILTYLAQFYHAFHSTSAKPRKLGSGSQNSSEPSTPSKSSSNSVRGGTATLLRSRTKESCTFCEKPVFIMERMNVTGHLLHRTCFKCRRCGAQLSMVNFYETEKGEFCCDMCPDEEKNHEEVTAKNKQIIQIWDENCTNSTPEQSGQELEKAKDIDDSNNNNKNSNLESENLDNDPIIITDDDEGCNNNSLGNICSQDGENGEKVANDVWNGVQDDPTTDLALSNLNIQSEPVNNQEVSDLKLDSEILTEDQKSKDEIVELCAEEENRLGSVKDEQEELKPMSYEKEKLTDVSEKDLDEANYPDTLNPFDDPADDEVNVETSSSEPKKEVEGTNPFGCDDSDEEIHPPVALPRTSHMSPGGTPLIGPPKPPRISLNPFGSDFEDDEETGNGSFASQPVRPPPSPSLSSSGGSSARKKRPAPQPPKLTTEPPVPSPRVSLSRVEMRRSGPPPPRPPLPTGVQPKEQKERENLNRRSQQMVNNERNQHEKVVTSDVILNVLPPNKATEGVWKKKKGPAPPRPIPPKLQVKKLPRKAVNQELHDIEVKQQELERQGVKLEKTIRELCNKSDAERVEKGLDNNDRDSLGPEAEDLIMQLFELVNEKNDLFRRQTELMYMKREHRLEEEHADIEYQIRVLMSKAETLRTDDEKLSEERLIQRLMEIVAQRNEIVDCLEMDRLRELEEDESIEVHMGEFAAVKPSGGDEKAKKKKKLKIGKKKKQDKMFDDDKDIDTSEISGTSPKPSPKKSALSLTEKDMAKKMKKKLLSSLKPVSSLHKKSSNDPSI